MRRIEKIKFLDIKIAFEKQPHESTPPLLLQMVIISSTASSVVINAPEKYGIPVIQLESKLSDLDSEIGELVKRRLESDFGVAVNAVDVSDIDIDTESRDYKDLMHKYK